MKRSLVALLIGSMLTSACPSLVQADTPPPVTGSVIITDAWGLRSAALDDKWQTHVLGTLSGPGLAFSSGATLLNGPAVAGLSETERQSLLAAPDLLTASSYVNQLVPTRWLLLLSVGNGDNPPMHPVLVDLQSHETHMLPDALGKTTDATLNELSNTVRDYLTHNTQAEQHPVKGNVVSKLYHLNTADHVQADDCITFASEADAKAHGYEPCSICYPKSKGIMQNDATEVALGREVASQVENQYKLSRNEKLKEKVDRIGQRLVDASDIRDFPYNFTLLQSDEINAFSGGAGNVFITTGILDVLESDDQIATVLGHEMAHCENHHIIRTYRSSQTMNIVGVIIGAATGGLGRFATNFMSMIFGRGYSRNFELQADHGGLLYTYAAGYKPEAFILTLKKLKDVEALRKGSKPPQWLRTHPTEEKRIDSINAELAMLHSYDEHVADVRAKDPGLAAAMQRHAFFYVDHPEIMTGFMTAYTDLKIDASHPITTTLLPPSSTKTIDPDNRD